MSALPMAPPPLPRQLERFLRRLKTKLKQSKLLRVLETLPASTTINFYENTLSVQSVRTFLGHRTQDDGSTAKSWAYVLLKHDVAEPAIIFRDEVSKGDEQVQSYRRSATSLLRRAGELLPPFRFLQYDSNVETHHVRNMVCALVLYYALAAGITDSATKWAKFECSLLEALRYIKSSGDYQSWRAEQHELNKILEATGQRLDTVPGDDESPDEVLDDVRGTLTLKRGGVVRSIGRSMVAKPGTLFAKLKDALGKQVDLLDAIPFAAITIERQDAFPDYFPFRLRLGAYRDANVYVYLAPELRSYVKILPEPVDDNGVHEWKFDELSHPQLHLSSPFDFLMGKDNQDLKSRAIKVRYFVYYYYMLAENQGLIDHPEIRTTAKTMLPKFTSACKDLRRAGHGVDETDSAEDSANEAPVKERSGAGPVHKQPVALSESLILKLRVKPEVLALFGGPKFPRTRPRINKGTIEQVINGSHAEDMQQDGVIPSQEPEDVLVPISVAKQHESVVKSDSPVQPSASEDMTASISEPDIAMPEQNKTRSISRDSGLGASRKSSAADIPDFAAAASWEQMFSLRTRGPSHQPEAVADDGSAVQDEDSAMDIEMTDVGEEHVVEEVTTPEGSEQEVVEQGVVEQQAIKTDVIDQEIAPTENVEEEVVLQEGVEQEAAAQGGVEQEAIMSNIVDKEVALAENLGQESFQRELSNDEDNEQDLVQQEGIHEGIIEPDDDHGDVIDQATVHGEPVDSVEGEEHIPTIDHTPEGYAKRLKLCREYRKYRKMQELRENHPELDGHAAKRQLVNLTMTTQATGAGNVIFRENIASIKSRLASLEEGMGNRATAQPGVDNSNDESRPRSNEPKPPPAQILAQKSIVVDLCSDDEDDIIGDTPKSEVEGTPDFEEVPHPSLPIVGHNRRSPRGQARVRSKKREYVCISSDDEDGVVKVQDGSAWKRASLGKMQEHPVILD